MSSKKYVLDPSGQIKDIESGENIGVKKITDQYMQQQGDFFGDRADFAGGAVKIPATNFLPSGVKGLAAAGADLIGGALSNNLKETGIIARETPVKTDNLFPDSNRDTLLVNPSFGADTDTKYYKNFNTAFSEFNANKNIFAEELEMVAGIEFNSLGLASVKGLDVTKILFIVDYILETTAYIATAVALLENSNQRFLKSSPLISYFHDILQFNYKNEKRNPTIKSVNDLISYFFIGLDQFINTDPKNEELKKQGSQQALLLLGRFSLNSTIEFTKLISNTILSFSKIGNNRLFLLIRKFQQESFWHSEILYNAKNSDFAGIGITAENAIDRFFAEFSQYYFKFAIERINVGHIIYKTGLAAERTKRKIYGARRHENFRALPGYKNTNNLQHNLEKSTDATDAIYDYYNWDSTKTETSSDGITKSSTTSVLSLPQLLKGYDYDIHRMKNDKIRQNFKSTKERRLSSDLVKIVENHLETEYMPFYFHDLRTNEILSFHAFIDSISDSFSPQYNPIKGFGRIDAVQHYMDTTRSISTTFKLVSFNADDHDMMWYQINKLVSMVYPQWSQGIKSIRKDVDKDFRFPFTQVPTASPLIRLRIGDIIKSNYSISNLSKLHGNKIKLKKKTIESVIIDPEVKEVSIKGFRYEGDKSIKVIVLDPVKFDEKGLSDFEKKIELANTIPKEIAQVKKLPFTSDTEIEELVEDNDGLEFTTIEENRFFPSTDVKKTISRFHKISSNGMFLYVPTFFLKTADKKVTPEKRSIKRKSTKITSSSSIENSVVKSELEGKVNNPFTKAYETSRGRGLAGFITNLDVNYNDVTWETKKTGGKAPMMATITISFAPIHDIPPGLDHEGIMRSPIYNVGNINNSMFGDVYDESPQIGLDKDDG